jgi:hypothetical protein
MAAPVTSIQILKDTTQHTVIKLTGLFDGTQQESNVARIVANGLYGAMATNGFPVANVYGGSANTPLSYYGLSVFRAWGVNSSVNGSIELAWSATTPKTIMYVSGSTDYDGYANWLTIPNNAAGTSGCLGDIAVTSRGMQANDTYTIVIELRKDNTQYQRGQFNDPAAFNYGAYGRTT